MSFQIVKFKITGIGALLQNNPASMVMKQDGVGTKKIPTPAEEAELKVFKNAKGEIYIPTECFRLSIIGKGGAASGRRINKRSAATVVAPNLFVVGTETVLCDQKTGKPLKDYKIHTTRAVVNKNGVMRSRPMLENWACEIAFEIDNAFLTKEMVLELLNIAGRVSGVGDFRISCKGTFGRFTAALAA